MGAQRSTSTSGSSSTSISGSSSSSAGGPTADAVAAVRQPHRAAGRAARRGAAGARHRLDPDLHVAAAAGGPTRPAGPRAHQRRGALHRGESAALLLRPQLLACGPGVVQAAAQPGSAGVHCSARGAAGGAAGGPTTEAPGAGRLVTACSLQPCHRRPPSPPWLLRSPLSSPAAGQAAPGGAACSAGSGRASSTVPAWPEAAAASRMPALVLLAK
jgi:hypothetical protein